MPVRLKSQSNLWNAKPSAKSEIAKIAVFRLFEV
jgi:hypothetical protein